MTTGRHERVALIIPARNEADSIERVVLGFRAVGVGTILVVDNGSTDGTAERARRAGATVVVEGRPGYGRACRSGIAALPEHAEIVVFADGDGSDDPADLARLLAPIRTGHADLVIGSRVACAAPGSLAPVQRFGNRLSTFLVALVTGVRWTDLGPFRAVRRSTLDRLGVTHDTFGWTVEMQLRASIAGTPAREIPVNYRPRLAGRSKIAGTISGSLRAGFGILSTIARRTPEAIRRRKRATAP